MLMPAAVLIMIVLGAVAVDRAVLFGAQRDLVAAAEAAANDGAAAGIHLDDLRDRAELRLDPERIDRAVTAAAGTVDGLVRARWHLEGTVLVVRLQRRVELVFAKGVPGAAHVVVVGATAHAELRRS
ncbi:MAG: hypothetical protein JWM47_1458 [Acidimicrobiales bacterium]|nr:hypothetical protein [Acidimicrobiales bacterium]